MGATAATIATQQNKRLRKYGGTKERTQSALKAPKPSSADAFAAVMAPATLGVKPRDVALPLTS